MKDKKLYYLLKVLGIIWGISLFLAFFQLYLMSLKLFFILLALVSPALPIWLHNLLYKKLEKKSRIGIIIYYLYAIINFIPLILQFLNIKQPGIDNIIASLIGLLMIYFKD